MFENYPADIRMYDADPRSPRYCGEEPKTTEELICELIGDDAFDFVALLNADDLESLNSEIGFCFSSGGHEFTGTKLKTYLGEQVLKIVHEALVRKVERMAE